MLNFSLERLVSVLTDGAPAVVGLKISFLANFKSELASLNLRNFTKFHCKRIAREFMCQVGKIIKCYVYLSSINIIKSWTLIHHHKEFLVELESEYGNLICYFAVCWLWKIFQCFYSLKEVYCFLEMRDKFVSMLKNNDYICDLSFLADIIHPFKYS